MTDVNELEKGMEQAKKENDRHRDMRSAEGQAALAVLRDFLSNSEDKLRKVGPLLTSADYLYYLCSIRTGNSIHLISYIWSYEVKNW